jgi:hypothetical protein
MPPPGKMTDRRHSGTLANVMTARICLIWFEITPILEDKTKITLTAAQRVCNHSSLKSGQTTNPLRKRYQMFKFHNETGASPESDDFKEAIHAENQCK